MPKNRLRLRIDCQKETYTRRLRIRDIRTFCKSVFAAEGIADCDCGIIFVDNNYIQDINLSYFNKPLPTDVISFPLHGAGKRVEGEIYISLEQAERQSCDYSVSLSEELQRLLIHGILHLLGYEDRTGSGKRHMTLKEDGYINEYGRTSLCRI